MMTDSIVYATASQENEISFVDGIIYGQDGKPLSGASVQVIFTGPGSSVSVQPYITPDGSYSAWTDLDTNYAFVVFKAPGYKDQTISFASLINNANVTMIKSAGGIGIDPDGSGSFPIWMIIAVVAAVAVLRKKKKKIGKLNKSDVPVIFMLVGGIIAYSVIEKLLEKLGIWGGKEITSEIQNPGSAWKEDYWKQFDSFTYAINLATAEGYARTIYNAFGLFSDDYSAVVGIFSQMRTKANVSFLADVFQAKYDASLLSFLTDGGGILPWDGLSNSHMKELINLVNKLPTH